MNAYSERYLDDAVKNLGEAFDYAVHRCRLSCDEFWNLFVHSGFAARFGRGEPRLVAGLSGTELVMQVLAKIYLDPEFPAPQTDYHCSPEYWCGSVLAYYQWKTTRPFKEIHQNISGVEILKLYSTLHEASEEKFVDTVNRIIERKNLPTKLQRRRKICGYSQRELAEKSGVNLRTLQQYELKTKKINKASVEKVNALAIVLNCSIEDLLEYPLENEG